MIHAALLGAALAFLLVGCGSAPSPSPSGPEPVTHAVRDAAFGLILTVARGSGTFRADEPIGVGASYTYLGPRETERVFHAASAIGYRIEELGGSRGMGGGMDQPCEFTDVAAGQPVSVPFGKAGAVSDVAGVGFDRAWYEDPVLRLPAGRWRIIAYLDVWLGACGGERHQLEATVGVEVEP